MNKKIDWFIVIVIVSLIIFFGSSIYMSTIYKEKEKEYYNKKRIYKESLVVGSDKWISKQCESSWDGKVDFDCFKKFKSLSK